MKKKLSKNSYDKKMLDNKKNEETKLHIPKNFHICLDDKGFQFLNLEKKRKNGELYKNEKYNKEFRRKFNIDETSFDSMKEAYFLILNSCNENRKKMIKLLKNTKKRMYNNTLNV